MTNMEVLIKSGPIGFLIIVIFSLLLVSGIVVVSIRPSRRVLFTFALLAFLPLLLGLLGTFIGNTQVPMSYNDPETARAMEAKSRRDARMPTYLGSGASAALLMAAGCGMALTKKSNKSSLRTAHQHPL
jgi:uncharacterized membrane protein YdfJ with MMPL/SSD domain